MRGGTGARELFFGVRISLQNLNQNSQLTMNQSLVISCRLVLNKGLPRTRRSQAAAGSCTSLQFAYGSGLTTRYYLPQLGGIG